MTNTYYVMGPDVDDGNKIKTLGQFNDVEHARLFAFAYFKQHFPNEERNFVNVYSSTELYEVMVAHYNAIFS